MGSNSDETSVYETFDRDEWSSLRAATPLTLTGADLDALRGINERLDLNEVENIYLPLSRLLNLHIAATQSLASVTDTFLGTPASRTPYIIGLAGSVAVGKSTAARVLQTLLKNWPNHPRVDLITTDGFLLPNDELRRRDLLGRKGFPESYDTGSLIRLLSAIKAGAARVEAPVYSHLTYDRVPDQTIVVERPDVVIVEGLNVLQPGRPKTSTFVSDHFDFSIYVDADERDIERWYVERFMTLRETVFTNPDSYFHHYARLNQGEATSTALDIWNEINGPNLHLNIAPTRARANLILTKGSDHEVKAVELRKY